MAKRTKDELKSPGITDGGAPGSATETAIHDQPTLGSAPTPAEAEAAVAKAQAKEDAPAPEPKRQLSSIPLRVFAQVSGLKPDQFVPFAGYAKREEMLPCPVPEWHERLKAFRNKPTR